MQFAFARDVVIMLPQYGSDELRLNGLEAPPRNLGKRRPSDEELPASPAGALGFTRESRIFLGTREPESRPPYGPESRRTEVSESSRPRPVTLQDTFEHSRGPTRSTTPEPYGLVADQYPLPCSLPVTHCKGRNASMPPCLAFWPRWYPS
jgi:hypothetical protein